MELDSTGLCLTACEYLWCLKLLEVSQFIVLWLFEVNLAAECCQSCEIKLLRLWLHGFLILLPCVFFLEFCRGFLCLRLKPCGLGLYLLLLSCAYIFKSRAGRIVLTTTGGHILWYFWDSSLGFFDVHRASLLLVCCCLGLKSRSCRCLSTSNLRSRSARELGLCPLTLYVSIPSPEICKTTIFW